MKQWIDERYFTELALAKPEELCAGGRAGHDPVTGRYTIRIWNEDYTFDGRNRLASVTSAATSSAAEESGIEPGLFSMFVIWYLLYPTTIADTGIWVSEHDFPGGTTFFRGPHLIPSARIATACDGDPERFTAACQCFGGTPLAMGDAAFRFAITPDIAVAVLFWLGDEDFPAEAKLLFDQGLVGKLPLDIIFALATEVCKRFK